MISALNKLLYRSKAPPSGQSAADKRSLQLATAALLMEVASADYDISPSERETIRALVEEKYAVTTEEAAAIAARAEQDSRQVTSLYPFTRKIVDACSMEERVRIVSMLWEVTAADGCIDDHEQHIVRKIANLLYVPHSEFIRTRLQHENN